MLKEKNVLLQEIERKICCARNFVLISQNGMEANQLAFFREQLVKNHSDCFFVKRRCFLKALHNQGFLIFEKAIRKGVNVGFAYTDKDFSCMAKVICSFIQQNENSVEILGAWLHGDNLSPQDVTVISKLPSLNELRSQFLATLDAPMRNIVVMMHKVLANVIFCLSEKIQQDEDCKR